MKIFKGSILGAVVLSVTSAVAHAQLRVYLSPNDIQSAEDSLITGVTTETFDGEEAGDYFADIDGYEDAIGIYTTDGNAKIQPNDQYGGTDEGNYLGIVSGSSVSLALNVPAAYFGFYFSAGDAGNAIEVKSNGVTLLSFNTAALIALLPNTNFTTIQAIDGSYYLTQNYYGQPGQDNGTGSGLMLICTSLRKLERLSMKSFSPNFIPRLLKRTITVSAQRHQHFLEVWLM